MKYYVVKYTGLFGFIKPWTAVRDAGGGETFSQQFLTPSIIEGIRQKLGVSRILRHKLTYAAINVQQETVQAKALDYKRQSRLYMREKSILKRGVMLHPSLMLAFGTMEEALSASTQHICLCRNEDVLLPADNIEPMEVGDFDNLPGFELRFEKNEKSFLVGYNRFDNNNPTYGWLDITGNPIQTPEYERL
jgi:uncharacterized protein YerC